jgi:hypothetical protein
METALLTSAVGQTAPIPSPLGQTAPIPSPQVLLEHYLKLLRLPTFGREYDKVAQQCAQEDVDHPRYLLRLCELEMLDRERRATERRIRAARFSVLKSLDSFDEKRSACPAACGGDE